MTLLLAGLIVFMGIHTLPWLPGARSSLIASLGEGRYRGLFALLSFVGLLMIILGMRGIAFVPVWEPPVWMHSVTAVLVFPALYMVIGRRTGSNVRRLTAHPMLWGISLWAGGHLLSNGDMASMCLFGAFFIYAQLDMAINNHRGARPSAEAAPLKAELKPFIISIIVYGLLFSLHPWIAGVSLVGV